MATKDLTYYFKCARPSSLLSSLSQATINSVNRELSGVSSVSPSNDPKSQGEYLKISSKEQATIKEYTAKNGIAAAIRCFKRNGEFQNLKESSVHGWKNAYCKELLSKSS